MDIWTVKSEALAKGRCSMSINVFPHIWIVERQLIWRDAHYRTILLMQFMHPLVCLATDDLSMESQSSRARDQRSWK